MKQLKLLIAISILFICSCGQSSSDKFEKYIGTWEPAAIEYGISNLSIEKIGENFQIKLSGSEMFGSYDKEHDKIILVENKHFGKGEIIYNPESKILTIIGGEHYDSMKFKKKDNK